MPKQVCMGATLRYSFGDTPSTLVVLPTNRIMTSSMPAATTAALGVLTPIPMPATLAPWAPRSNTVMLANIPALNNTCSLNCMWVG